MCYLKSPSGVGSALTHYAAVALDSTDVTLTTIISLTRFILLCTVKFPKASASPSRISLCIQAVDLWQEALPKRIVVLKRH
jgi:hypothetical protein